jgi:hypothetical protein
VITTHGSTVGETNGAPVAGTEGAFVGCGVGDGVGGCVGCNKTIKHATKKAWLENEYEMFKMRLQISSE